MLLFFLGAISSYPLYLLVVSLEKNETTRRMPLLSGLGIATELEICGINILFGLMPRFEYVA